MKHLSRIVTSTFGIFILTALACMFVAQASSSAPVFAQEETRARNECNTVNPNADNCPLLRTYIIPAINALAGAAGLVVLIMIVWGGLQYTTSRDNPQQAAAAKDHIRNALYALVFYIFMVAFLNWIVPGGVF